jgi:hypothetical protein
LRALIAALGSFGGGKVFDTSKIFLTGCSMGSAFTLWAAQCLHLADASAVRSFATQSTGLKVKGDGLVFPPDNYDPEYTWGECPQCQFFPAPVIQTSDLKACVVDQRSDGFHGNASFYKSSLALHAAWAAADMRTNLSVSNGGHCQTASFEWIAECLDDGTGRLLRARGTEAAITKQSTPLVEDPREISNAK